jgi:hypothetical protein
MHAIRKFCGWFFGPLAIICLSLPVLHLRRDVLTRHSATLSRALIVDCIMISLAFVFALAWWTTWKARPTARAWGITASLTELAFPLSLMRVAHAPLTNPMWMMIVDSVICFIAYAWPEGEKGSLAGERLVESDSAPQ